MHTVKLKISTSGAIVLTDPDAKPGSVQMVYAINGVPAEVTPAAVARRCAGICFAHSIYDDGAWAYDWQQLANLKPGAIVNRYRAA